MAVHSGWRGPGHLSRWTAVPSGGGTAAPTLSSPADLATSPTGAAISVSTDTATGTLYWFISTSSTPPTATNLKAGTGSAASGSQAVTSSGPQSATASGLSASTAYYTHFLQHDSVAGLDSDIVSSDGFTTLAAPDTVAPTLSSPSSFASGTTTATSSVDTDEANGTIYAFLSSSATPPTSTALKAGTGAVASHSGTVTVTGPQPVNWTGLTTGTTYYTHWLHTDAANNDSLIVSDAGFTTAVADTTAPVLSAATGTPSSATTATIGVTTDEGNGTLYAFVSTSASAPTAAALKAGTGAIWFGNQAISSTGAKTFSATGLTASTAYYAYFLHRDAAGNDSSIAAASSFTTDAIGAGPALSASTLTLTSGATYPPTIDFTRPVDWVDGISAVMQRSQDPTFATGTSETIDTINSATTTYDFGLSTVTSGTWFFRMAAWANTRPTVLNWSNSVSATAVSPSSPGLKFNYPANSQYLPAIAA